MAYVVSYNDSNESQLVPEPGKSGTVCRNSGMYTVERAKPCPAGMLCRSDWLIIFGSKLSLNSDYKSSTASASVYHR